MLKQQIPQTVFVAILRTEMARSVSIYVLSIYVCSGHEHSLNHSWVTSYTSYMEGCSEISRARVNFTSILNEQLNQVYMALIASYMQWSPTVTIALVNQCLSKIRIFSFKNFHTSHHIVFFCCHPNRS